MTEKKNYAKFRSELLNLCPGMDEQEVYLKWWKYQFRDSTWEIHQKPTWGCDRKYHMVYITITGLGKIYVGVHSTPDLCDGYHGSGDEIRKLRESGALLETIPLEFFRTRGEALAMEEYIVDRDFIIEPGVLNHTLGGDDSRHDNDMKSHDIVPKSCPKVVQPTIPSPTLKIPGTAYELPKEACDIIDSFGANIPPAPKSVQNEPKKRKGNFYTFADLSVAIGEILTFAQDESIACKVIDNDCMVEYKGRQYKLTDLTKKILNIDKLGYTTLGYWKLRGQFLVNIADELKKKKQKKAA